MVGKEYSLGNLSGLTKKSYFPRVARRFNRKNVFRNSCFYVFMTRYFFLISILNCSRDFLSVWGDRTRCTRLVILVIKRSNHYAYIGGHYFIISFQLTPLHVLLIRSIQQRHGMDVITTLVDYVLEFLSAFFRRPRSKSAPAKISWFLAAEPV